MTLPLRGMIRQYRTLASLKSTAAARRTFDGSWLRWLALLFGCMGRAQRHDEETSLSAPRYGIYPLRNSTNAVLLHCPLLPHTQRWPQSAPSGSRLSRSQRCQTCPGSANLFQSCCGMLLFGKVVEHVNTSCCHGTCGHV